MAKNIISSGGYLLLILLISISSGVYCQFNDSIDFYFDLPIEELAKIEISTTNKVPELISETPTAINVITEAEIDLLNFNTLQEILEYSGGQSSVNGEGNVFTTTTIRGNTQVNYNTNTLLVIDGIPLTNGYHGSFDLQAIPVSSIKRVEIIKGSNSVLYGSNAMNGIISVITKDAKNSEKGQYKGKLKYGSYNTVYFNSAYSKKNDVIKFNAFADVMTTSGEPHTYMDEGGNSLTFNKKYTGVSLVSNVKVKNLTIHGQYFSREEPVVRTREFQRVYLSEVDTVGILIPEEAKESMLVGNIAYKLSTGRRTELRFRGNIIDWTLRKDFSNGYWDYSSNAVYTDVEYAFPLSEKSDNLIGLSYNNYIGRRFKSQTSDYDIGKFNERTNEIAIFLNGNYQWRNKLKFFYGGRFFLSKYQDVTLTDFSPRIAITYNIVNNLFIKAIAGKSYRVPTYFEKEVASEKVTGNPNLLPEKSISYDLVLTNTIDNYYLNVNTFFTIINDQITRIEDPQDPDKRMNQNVGTSNYYGLEINVKAKFNKFFNGFSSYTYTDGYSKEDKSKLKFIYQHMFSLGVEFSIFDQLKLRSSAKYLSDWGAAESYFVVNAGMNYKPFKEIPLFVEIKADNLLDESIYLPEIARDHPSVPVIPSNMNRKLSFTLSYMLK